MGQKHQLLGRNVADGKKPKMLKVKICVILSLRMAWGLDFRKDLKRGSNFKPLLFIVQHLNMQILMMYQLGSSWSMPIQRKPHFSAKGKLQLCSRVTLPFIFAEAFVTIYALIYALQNVGQHIWLLSRKYWLALTMRSWSSGCWAWKSTFLQ